MNSQKKQDLTNIENCKFEKCKYFNKKLNKCDYDYCVLVIDFEEVG